MRRSVVVFGSAALRLSFGTPKRLFQQYPPEAAFQKVLLLIASANCDESRWEQPDRLDITRRVARHIAFGTGIHGCMGQPGSEAKRSALAARVASITLEATPCTATE